MLARLGRAPVWVSLLIVCFFQFNTPSAGQNYQLFRAIRDGAEFFLSDNDYLKYPDVEVKRETPSAEAVPSEAIRDSVLSMSMSIAPPPSSSVTLSTARTRKRLHRSAAATVKSYALPDSDEESSTRGISEASRHRGRTHTTDSDLQLWIKHLSALQKDETKKVCTTFFSVMARKATHGFSSSTRKNGTSSSPIYQAQGFVLSGCVFKDWNKHLLLTEPRSQNDFLRTLTAGLRELRQLDSAKKQQAHVPAVPDEHSESDDDEYQCRRRPSRRRKTSAN